MWTTHAQPIDRRTLKFTLHGVAGDLTFRDVVQLWQESAEFRAFFTAVIANSAFDAFFWETPPVSNSSFDRPFEFVLTDSPGLSQLRPDPSPFMRHFPPHGAEDVVSFPNLGRDAILIVPVPVSEAGSYTHLAKFLRKAPAPQVNSFWLATGHAVAKSLSDLPLWLSTAGMGVSWLHLRLDSYPKYYRYTPYTTGF